MSFLLESLLIALVGGLLGCALGSLTNGWTANSIVGSGQGGGKSVVLKLVVDQRILAQGLLLTLAMGFAGGLLPAFRAVRLKALESLRQPPRLDVPEAGHVPWHGFPGRCFVR